MQPYILLFFISSGKRKKEAWKVDKYGFWIIKLVWYLCVCATNTEPFLKLNLDQRRWRTKQFSLGKFNRPVSIIRIFRFVAVLCLTAAGLGIYGAFRFTNKVPHCASLCVFLTSMGTFVTLMEIRQWNYLLGYVGGFAYVSCLCASGTGWKLLANES